jgi:hypothetical protein
MLLSEPDSTASPSASRNLQPFPFRSSLRTTHPGQSQVPGRVKEQQERRAHPESEQFMMQVVLYPRTFSVAPEDIREPVEARWKAFRNEPPPARSDAKPIPEARQVYGTWSIDGSLWQAIKFLVPLIGIIALW